MSFRKVAIFGAGTMGSGIAYALALKGIDVMLFDISQEVVERAKGQIELKLLKRDIEKGKIGEEKKKEILERIEIGKDFRMAKEADLVIEATFEDFSTKEGLFRQLASFCPSSTIFSSNTSTLSITRLAEVSSRPERFIGMHFFNPAHIMRPVEIIPGMKTENETIDLCLRFVEEIGKAPFLVKNCPGFLVNRILLSYVSEAYLLLEEGVPPEIIDETIKKIGFPMGPLELSDMVGHDISLHTFPILHRAYGERFPIPRIVEALVRYGRYGNKSGKGIYRQGKIDEEFIKIAKEVQRPSDFPFSAQRLILRAVNEAIYCLSENVAGLDQIDRAMVLGTGFPFEGPLHFADQIGLDETLSLLEDFSKYAPSRFWPHYLLREYVDAGYLGKKIGRGFFEYKKEEV